MGAILMTLFKSPNGEITISLTDVEVRCCFYSYDRLFAFSDSVKAALTALVETVARGEGLFGATEITATVWAKKNEGCKISLRPDTEKKVQDGKKAKCYLLEADTLKNLADAAAHICRKGQPPIDSRLYKTEKAYALLLKFDSPKRLCGADEFGSLTKVSPKTLKDRPVIYRKAAEKLCDLFYKDFK
jgi:hypothetical protein